MLSVDHVHRECGIPDWVSKAYIDSYRGPRDDVGSRQGPQASWLPASH